MSIQYLMEVEGNPDEVLGVRAPLPPSKLMLPAPSQLNAFEIFPPNLKISLGEPWFGLFTCLAGQDRSPLLSLIICSFGQAG